MSEWKEYRLGDIADCALGKMLDQKKNQGTPRPYLNNVSLRWGSFNIDYSQTMLFEDSELERYQIKKNDIIMCEGGEPGRCAVWTNESPICYQKALHRIRVKEGFDNWFLYYYLRHFVLSGRAQVFFTGTTIKHFPLQALKSIVIKAPAFQVQQKIASILSSLDSKIENNRKISANLEAQAQALFKHWFIDFAPFKDGKFVESELGMIPEGWRVSTIGKVCKCELGGTPSRANKSYWGGNIAWINSGAVNSFRICQASEFITDEGLNRSATKLLPAKTTVLAITGATLGQVSLLEIDSCANQSVVGIKENEKMPYTFIYPLIKSKIKELMLMQTGGAQQHINKDNIQSLKIVLSPDHIMSDYNSITQEMYAQIGKLCFENLRLSTLRDTLLPKLMSGEIKV